MAEQRELAQRMLTIEIAALLVVKFCVDAVKGSFRHPLVPVRATAVFQEYALTIGAQRLETVPRINPNRIEEFR